MVIRWKNIWVCLEPDGEKLAVPLIWFLSFVFSNKGRAESEITIMKWKKCSSLVRYLLGLMAPIQWVLHPDENRWFWFMPIDPGVENVQLFLIYLLRFLLLPFQFNKKFIFLPPTYILTIPMCSTLLGVRLLYRSLVRETKEAGVYLQMHSL